MVKPCTYKERMSGKEYHFWMTPDALYKFNKIQVLLDDKDRSRCKDCIIGRVHQQAACPQKGDKRPQENVLGQLQKATKNRILLLLASVISRALINNKVRSELQEQLTSKRVQ